jgi:opacity protein-like surface antigen
MKKVILTTMMFCSVYGFSQDFKFGVKGGLNVASQDITVQAYQGVNTSLKNVIGINIGVFGQIKVSEKFYLQPELFYSMQGQALEIVYNGQKATQTLEVNYIVLPVMAKYYTGKKFSIQAGPQLAMLVAATEKIDSSISGLPSSSTEAKSNYNSTDFGLNFGLGYEISKNVSLATRYNIGFSDVEKTVSPGTSASKNRVFSIGVEYKF